MVFFLLISNLDSFLLLFSPAQYVIHTHHLRNLKPKIYTFIIVYKSVCSVLCNLAIKTAHTDSLRFMILQDLRLQLI